MTTRRDYGLTLRRCIERLDQQGSGRLAADVTGEDWQDVLIELWGHLSAATWNRNLAAVATFLEWLGDAEVCTVRLPALCKARKIHIDETKAEEREDLEFLWAPTVDLRERALWRVLYESSSRAEAVLSLDVENVDLRRRRAKAVLKGGNTLWVHFEERGGELLREYIGDRTSGPLWLTNRRPRNWRDRPASDRSPDGRHYRLSYNRAARIIKTFSAKAVAVTLHILRHSRLTHLAEDGVDTPMLQAISGHTNPATLHRRYSKPTSRAVQKLFAQRSAAGP
ncbi:tyrosine-type recombinase/integrase [Streptomyces sp. NPDC008079]|uniref:tyrosine-type recombinase/integrase n=1 Tax=Streptomyces sp. NPDC008079 TaxID=3364806 RepID=UPI0036F15922